MWGTPKANGVPRDRVRLSRERRCDCKLQIGNSKEGRENGNVEKRVSSNQYQYNQQFKSNPKPNKPKENGYLFLSYSIPVLLFLYSKSQGFLLFTLRIAYQYSWTPMIVIMATKSFKGFCCWRKKGKPWPFVKITAHFCNRKRPFC